jgi:hypothetical protein
MTAITGIFTRTVPGSTRIAFSGEISTGDTHDLQFYVSTLPDKLTTVIYLDSPGGNLAEGVAWGSSSTTRTSRQ